MTRSESRSGESWESSVAHESAAMPGVRFRVARMTFGKRLELTRELRQASARLEYAEAGGSEADRLEAILLSHEMDRVYLEWGLLGIEGLAIDGEPATAAGVIERGPLPLVEEILERIKGELGLTADERKN